jgi:PAS domain S-box-containing protein
MDVRELSDQQLQETLRALQRPEESAGAAGRLQEIVQELQVHRIELEMQNRSLQEMQVELEHSIQRYTDLYDNLPLGYLTVSSEGRILQANLSAAEMLRVPREKLPGTFVRSFLDSYEAGRFAGHLETCVESGRPASMEVTLRLKDGSTRMVQFASRRAPESLDGLPQILVGVTDISQLKQAQRVLEEVNREQEAFNYSISHDLRAPLVTINTYAAIVLGEHAQQLDEEGRGMVQRIRAAAQRMEATLKHLLEYSTLAREEIVLEAVDTEEAVKELLIEHRGVIQERKAEIFVARPLPPVRGCRAIFNQVLANLLTNALKYTRPEEPPRVRIFAEQRDALVLLRVADDGIGIDPKYHERIFQIFERLHGYSRYPGSGVGLAIARRAVERMNGRIWVESEPGHGSCFCLELPRA